jgi:hypothetical protein
MPPKTKVPSETAPVPKQNDLPDEDRLKESAAAAQKALDAQSYASKLRNTASSVTDPKKREKILRDAYDKEVEAHGNSKKARMLASGAFQGGVGGAGIGGAVGAGVGTLVGTVVGTVAAIPTTAIGGLAGVGVGAAHGPWIKLPPLGGDKKEEKVQLEDREATEGAEADESIVPNPDTLRQAADAVAAEREKRRPRKLSRQSTAADIPTPEKRKPRKIEIRSKQQQQSVS